MELSGDRAGEPCFIGWDVGAWYCDNNSTSRDAIVILDAGRRIIGKPWRGNLRVLINEARSTHDWVAGLFDRCEAKLPDQPYQITMAIDTPLGFSDEFRRLVSELTGSDGIAEEYGKNCYLFRHTERHLIKKGFQPLSAVQAQLGSQATKGMHVLAKFASRVEVCGVWTDGASITAIETYPTPARESAAVKGLLIGRNRLKPVDMEDARTCALVAYLFATKRHVLEEPPPSVPEREGWIWLPKDVCGGQGPRR